MLVFIISGLVILAYCSQASNERTYQEVVWAVCGKLTGVLCEVAIATYTLGPASPSSSSSTSAGQKVRSSSVSTSSLPLGPGDLAVGREEHGIPTQGPEAPGIHLGILPAGCWAHETVEIPAEVEDHTLQ